MNFTSCRRYYLDEFLHNHEDKFHGIVLDVGGKKSNSRGDFRPPFEQVNEWLFLNNDKGSNPDILANLPNVPIKDNTVDVVLCTEVIEYIHDYQKMLSEVSRVLKENGVLLLSAPFLCSMHGDSKYDYYRLTESLLNKELSKNFTIASIDRTGGLISIVYDLIKNYLSYQTDKTMLNRLMYATLLRIGRAAIWFDSFLFKNRDYINGGYFIVATKSDYRQV